MPNKIKVLQLQSRYNVNASDLAEQIIRALPTEKYEITSAYLKGRPAEDAMLSVAPKVKYFDFSSKQLKGRRYSAIGKLQRFCIAEDFDIVITHRFKPIHMMMQINRKQNFKKCIGITHGLGDYDRFYRKLLFRFLTRRNWTMVAVSPPVKDYLINAKAGFTQANTVTINNAIDIDATVAGLQSRMEAREFLSLPAKAFVFGTIGRLVPVKGHLVMLKAFKLLANSYPNAHIAIIGDGRLHAELEAYIASNKLEERVTLCGEIPDAYRLVRSFNVFVLPSLSEGLPLALLEGISASLPVIGSDIPSIAPLIDGVGKIFKSGDEHELSKAMKYYLDMSAPQLKTEGERHFSHACKNYSILDYRKHYLDLIEK